MVTSQQQVFAGSRAIEPLKRVLILGSKAHHLPPPAPFKRPVGTLGTQVVLGHEPRVDRLTALGLRGT